MPYRTIPLEHLNKLLELDHLSPTFLRKKATGKPAGHSRLSDGRARVSLKIGNKYHHLMANRIVWAIANQQQIPTGYVIDHIDGNPYNNNPTNLRAVLPSVNAQNTRPKSSNMSGYKGIHQAKDKWVARVTVPDLNGGRGKRRSIGSFATPEEARMAIQSWQQKHGLEVTHQTVRKIFLVNSTQELNHVIEWLRGAQLPITVVTTSRS